MLHVEVANVVCSRPRCTAAVSAGTARGALEIDKLNSSTSSLARFVMVASIPSSPPLVFVRCRDRHFRLKGLFCVCFALDHHRYRRRRSCLGRLLGEKTRSPARPGAARRSRGARRARSTSSRQGASHCRAPVGRCRRVLDPPPVRAVVVSRLLFARRSARSGPVSSSHRDGRRPRGAGAGAVWVGRSGGAPHMGRSLQQRHSEV